MEYDQEILRIRFRGSVCINKTIMDNRGWYVCSEDGIFHLYNDGIVRSGANNPDTNSSAFWESKKKAREFYQKWKDGKEISCSLCGHML